MISTRGGAGKPAVHIVLGDVGEDNKNGGWSHLRRLGDPAHGGTKEPYLDWLHGRLNADKDALSGAGASPAGGDTRPTPAEAAGLNARIAEAEAVLAKFGNDPRGGPAKPDAIVAQAPAVITLPVPEDATGFFAGGKLDINSPDVDPGGVQWMATADTPPDPHTVLPGVLTVLEASHRDRDATRRRV